jgi:hypothetical protein
MCCFIISSNYNQQSRCEFEYHYRNVLSNSYDLSITTCPLYILPSCQYALWYKCASPVIGQVAICATVAL